MMVGNLSSVVRSLSGSVCGLQSCLWVVRRGLKRVGDALLVQVGVGATDSGWKLILPAQESTRITPPSNTGSERNSRGIFTLSQCRLCGRRGSAGGIVDGFDEPVSRTLKNMRKVRIFYGAGTRSCGIPPIARKNTWPRRGWGTPSCHR